MTWFPAPLSPTTSTGLVEQPIRQLLPFYKGIVDLPVETLRGCWSDQPQLYDPRHGRVAGHAAFADYVATTREWLALSDATTRPLASVYTATRSVEELVVELEVGGERRELGAAVVGELDAQHRLTAIRVYHSLWPLPEPLGSLPVRPTTPELTIPGFVLDHHRARRAGDLEAVLASYEPEAVVVAVDGPPQVWAGTAELRRLYATAELPVHSSTTTVCAVTDDGRTCAVEYQVIRYGGPGPDEGGLTTYRRGPHGKILGERRYRVPTPTRFASAPPAPGVVAAAAPSGRHRPADRRVGLGRRRAVVRGAFSG